MTPDAPHPPLGDVLCVQAHVGVHVEPQGDECVDDGGGGDDDDDAADLFVGLTHRHL